MLSSAGCLKRFNELDVRFLLVPEFAESWLLTSVLGSRVFGGMFSLENDRGKLARLLFSAFIDIRRVIYKLIFSTWEVNNPLSSFLKW